MPNVQYPYPLRHHFRDPIHGFIPVSDPERKVIDSKPIQRLRRIHQLGTGYLVYHGAEHSRFGHSLGTMYLAGRAFEQIHEKVGLLGEGDEISRNWQIMRLAGLLHDIGHTPFSHAAAILLPSDGRGRTLKHEDYSAAILNSQLDEIIPQNFSELGIEARDVAAVFSADPSRLGRPATIMHQLLSGEVDVDRMDYLLRDSHYAGVAYGRYDVERLIQCFTAVDLTGQHVLAIESGGLGALEGFIYARYFMYTQVYLHDVKCFFDLELQEALTDLLEDEGMDGRYPGPGNVDRFLELDDEWAIGGLKRRARSGCRAADSIVARRNWRTVAQTTAHPRKDVVLEWAGSFPKVVNRFGNKVKHDTPSVSGFQATEPRPYRAVKEEGTPVMLVDEQGSEEPALIEAKSIVIDQLSREPVMFMRLYASPDVEEDVKDFWFKLVGDKQ